MSIVQVYKPEDMISGMALGIDTMWAELALEWNIRLTAAIPCGSQPDRWPKASQTRYYRILDRAYRVYNVSGKVLYKPEYMQQRNIWMVDQLVQPEDILVGVWNGTPGGTHNCLKYAGTKLSPNQVIIISPQLL